MIKLVRTGLYMTLSFVTLNVMGQEENPYHDLFTTSDNCIACHSNMVGPDGEDISIGYTWRASMMGNSSRDPYWMAGVRRETMDHPQAQAEIEDTCSVCHMPMARTEAVAAGGTGLVFDHLQGKSDPVTQQHAFDGVSCTVCHQINASRLGDESSFDGGYVIDLNPDKDREIYGPFDIDDGRTRIMQSATNNLPQQGLHIQQSELCATCHTLFTNSLDDNGRVAGRFPEQVPYLEWLASDYVETQSCQTCHMPEVKGDAPISSVLGEPREGFSQHVFLGGNAFMLRMMNQHRDELGVIALPQEMEASAARTELHLQTNTANLSIDNISRDGDELRFAVTIENLAGHKFPTAYPSRRAWLHVTVNDSNGNIIFESGALNNDGSIKGNDNDDDSTEYEPHYAEITRADQVQIYEPVLVDANDRITTSLLSAYAYKKDNRLLPEGLSKATASEDIASYGKAIDDTDFDAGGDIVNYKIQVSSDGPVSISAKLYFQTIGYRWANNLKRYNAAETNRFTNWYDDNAHASAVTIAKTQVLAAP